MTFLEFKDYIEDNGFQKTERNTFSKKYGDLYEISYKIKKDQVIVYRKAMNKKQKVMKSRLKALSILEDGTLQGFKQITKEN